MFTKEHVGEIKLPLGANGELTPIELCEADEPIKILGELSNLALLVGEHVLQARLLVLGVARENPECQRGAPGANDRSRACAWSTAL